MKAPFAASTRIELYRPTRGLEAVVGAIKSRAAGRDTGCPDLSGT